MKKFTWILASLSMAWVIMQPASRLVRADDLGASVRVFASPTGPWFSVDGQNYNIPMSAVWPAGSKHTLGVDSTVSGPNAKTQWTFNGWQTANGAIPGGNRVIVTADPNVTEYKAIFNVEYALTLIYFSCPDVTHCSSPGTIWVGGAPYNYDQDIYQAAGAQVTLTATPNPGWVFAGWNTGANQTVTGTTTKVTMSAPTAVYPVFQVARTVNLQTVPAGLEVLADRTMVPTPNSFDWGWGSVHSVGPVSPQQDRAGRWWVFSSWSDSGAATHAYKVAQVAQPDTLTATYIPAAGINISTLPQGLKINIDGRDNWPTYQFAWGEGETHHVNAPLEQVDTTGHLFDFVSWSDGGPASHDITVPTGSAEVGMVLKATYKPMGRVVVTSPMASVSVNVDGQDCPTPCEVRRDVGTAVHITAPGSMTAGNGARMDFDGWSGGDGSKDWSATLGPDPVMLTASYHLMNRLIAAATPPDGASWSMQPASPDGYYDARSNVTVSVTALPGYKFRSWNGDLSGSKPIGVLSMNAPRSVQAILDRSPYIAPAGVANAAGQGPDPGVASGSIISIFGASLSLDLTPGPASPLAQTLDGVVVKTVDRVLPLFFVSPTQINLQIPDDVQPGDVLLTVSSQDLPDVKATVSVVRNAPGLFQQIVAGDSYAVVTHEDGSAVTPDSPAKHGELLTMYGTGFGPLDHPRPTGFPLPDSPQYMLLDTATVVVADAEIAAESAFGQPSKIGVDLVQFRLADGTPSGNSQVRVRVNGHDSNTVLLPVE
jgi:uncharacterized protein (TIGR03437 family)